MIRLLFQIQKINRIIRLFAAIFVSVQLLIPSKISLFLDIKIITNDKRRIHQKASKSADDMSNSMKNGYWNQQAFFQTNRHSRESTTVPRRAKSVT